MPLRVEHWTILWRRLWPGLVTALVGAACSRPDPAPFKPPLHQRFWAHSPRVCGVDEVREFFCDELLPLTSALPAPEPYANCPSSIETHVGLHEPLPPVAVFDTDFTAHTRKRMPPGHSCCYSWCSPINVLAPELVAPVTSCGSAMFRETYCLQEPESGTSKPALAGFERCPAAIAPPSGAAFQVSKGALFEYQETAERRAKGFQECCYGWCSQVPASTGLEKR